MSHYTDPSENFKTPSSNIDYNTETDFSLVRLSDITSVSRRSLAIFAMWLTGRGIPERFHDLILALFITGNWDSNGGSEVITTWRLARSISPGEDTDKSIERVYNKFKKQIPDYFDWQSTQTQEVIHREIINDNPGYHRPKSSYSFPDYKIIVRLWNLPQNLTQKAIRAAVSRSLQAFDLPIPVARKKRKRSIETAKKQNAQTVKEILEGTISPEHAGLELKEAWERVLDRQLVERIKITL